MIKKKVRDAYGNWIWVDDEYENSEAAHSKEIENVRKARRREIPDSAIENEKLKLEWRDYIALTLASLQTILLPIVVFILVIFGILLVLALR